MPKFAGKMTVVCLLLLYSNILFVYASAKQNELDVFSQQNIKIDSGQIIHRLLVASADAVVAGTIQKGIIVVDGSLTLMPEAKVNGKIIVIGGTLSREAGAVTEDTPWIINIQGASLRNMLIGILCLLVAVPLFIIPVMLWASLKYLRNKALFRRLTRWFLYVQHRYPLIYILGTLIISGLMLVTFFDVVWQTIFQSTTEAFDNAVIWLVRYFATAGLDRVMIFVTNLGYGYTYLLIVAAAFVVLGILKRWIEVRGLALCLLGGAVLNELLKNLFERARPDVFRVVEASGYSFPSGHAMVSLCFYGMLAFLIARNISLWRWRMVIMISAALFILLIGISRIYLGVHYPSDVVAGYTVGATWLAFSISLLMWWERKHSMHPKQQ